MIPRRDHAGDLAHLVHLAELELSPDEAEYLRLQLNSQRGCP
jgi:Asp-tRNA(Asn)/Glu-tRNA(Gln) amidotransferase C subunit